MLCHGVMDCMMDAPEGLLPCTAGGGDPRWGARGGREARSDQVGLADEKEWKRLWRIMRLSDGRAAHEDVDMDDAPLEPCAEAAQAGGGRSGGGGTKGGRFRGRASQSDVRLSDGRG
ncbi:unnamed protein product [Ostreobium quekettii]|uniref:Uncharacterized protein n=1 Tax=Ostreobium quekettii TaxID=121088 RepID=A0A8S1J1Q0_9CHLO|nr:unnamed protein product [Ostreobium quekettii]